MIRINKGISVLALGIFLLLSGCANKPNNLYYWGNYQSVIYDMYIEPDRADTLTQQAKLTEDIEQADNNGQKVAPGIYAHLGFIQAALGETDRAKASFEMEKTLYPESSVFIDGILQGSNKKTMVSNEIADGSTSNEVSTDNSVNNEAANETSN